MLLLVLFSVSLIGPAVLAGPETRLPECCRRLGKHHCVLASPQEQSAGASLRSFQDRCPYFPAGPVVPAHQYSSLSKARQMVPNSLLVYHSRQAPAEFRSEAPSGRSHQKRGPPAGEFAQA